jgi:hypothetical protein
MQQLWEHRKVYAGRGGHRMTPPTADDADAQPALLLMERRASGGASKSKETTGDVSTATPRTGDLLVSTFPWFPACDSTCIIIRGTSLFFGGGAPSFSTWQTIPS